MEKVNKEVAFKDEIDIGQFTSSSIDRRSKKSCKYNLFGVVVHRGYDLYSGHYYAYIKGMNNLWYVLNDESVKEVPAARVFKEHAYILLYSRKDIPKPKGSLEQIEEPVAKSKEEAAKTAKNIMAEILNLKSKTNEPKKMPGSKKEMPDSKKEEEKMVVYEPEGSKEIVAPSPKMTNKAKSDTRSPGPMFPTNKRKHLLKLANSNFAAKKPKKEAVESEPIIDLPASQTASQRYFNAESAIQHWEADTKHSKLFEKRVRKMNQEAKVPEKKQKNYYEREYDKGKTKKIKDKSHKKNQEGLQKLFNQIDGQNRLIKLEA